MRTARTLLGKARGDITSLRVLHTSDQVPDWSWAFHGQQAIEKSLKAVLAAMDVDYPYTHKLTVLLIMLENLDVSTPPHADRIDLLSPFGALSRYEGQEEPDASTLDSDEVLMWAEHVFDWAGSEVARLSNGISGD